MSKSFNRIIDVVAQQVSSNIDVAESIRNQKVDFNALKKLEKVYSGVEDPYVKAWINFLKTHMESVSIFDSYLRNQPIEKEVVERTQARRLFVAEALGYVDSVTAKHAQKMKLSPMVGLTPLLELHQKIEGENSLTTLEERKRALSDFDWDALDAPTIINIMQKMIAPQKIGPNGSSRTQAIPLDAATVMFTKICFDAAKLQLMSPQSPDLSEKSAFSFLLVASGLDKKMLSSLIELDQSYLSIDLSRIAKMASAEMERRGLKEMATTISQNSSGLKLK
jgi:hypothetical protein